MNEWPAAGVQFHGVSKLWCKGAFPSLQIQNNLNMKDENERTARLCGSCESEGNACAGNSFSFLRKKRRKKEDNQEKHPKDDLYCILFHLDGFPSVSSQRCPCTARTCWGQSSPCDIFEAQRKWIRTAAKLPGLSAIPDVKHEGSSTNGSWNVFCCSLHVLAGLKGL